MAKNDMKVIEYKILAYLYESLKAGIPQRLKRQRGNAGFLI